MDQSGRLSIKVIDTDKNAVADAVVSVDSSIPENERIYDGTTDANGMCDVGKVLQGQYEYSVTAQRGNRTYSERKSFQVFAGDKNEIQINPFENVGGLKIKIVNWNSEPISYVNVAIIPHPRYSNDEYFFQDLMDESYAVAKTNLEGVVEFSDLPAGTMYGREYSVLAYFDSENYAYPSGNNSQYVYRNTTRSYTVKVNLE